MTELVNVDNFVRAETARMFDGTLAHAGGVNRFVHLRAPTPVDRQSVIRMNRDTLYSALIADISQGATLTIPDAGDRYLSAMVVNEDHFVMRVLHEPGVHQLTLDEYGTPFVGVSVRTFVDPNDPADVAAVNGIQDRLALDAPASGPYTHPDYDTASLDAVREPLLQLSESLPDSARTFGAPDEVDPVRHLIGTAYGWGGLPEREAFYLVEAAPHPVGHYRITFHDVPVDGFWSLTVYNRDGFLEPNQYAAWSINNVTAVADEDGSVTVDLAPEPDGFRNHLYVMDGWNYAIRLYRPRPEILDGRWIAPAPEAVGAGSR
ncbi:DUF1214 domain-containing protein [Mycobacterium sp. Y57]|uniref:DUF1214 domain-containing protein n=1 Tax=Mycolicibacterium xanthum TaxID=2796469 RepID=UPI001C85CE99|nr:DUF1214 domain-containing protein [Mycolicibacterium xanthum]MBX7430634.1 DUF1214 domain-containing protein [Mycolicibacterium xanthum]